MNKIKNLPLSQVTISDDSRVSLSRWDKERLFSIWTPGFVGDISTDRDRIIITNPDKTLTLYPTEKGFEYEMFLFNKPPSNVIELGIDTTGLTYTKQLPLTEELKQDNLYDKITETDGYNKDGIDVTNRPVNIVNSYVFKHDTMSRQFWSDKADAEKYKTGTFGTLYRPYERTHGVWLDQQIEGNKYRIILPYDLWNNATYPLIIDPDFGGTPTPNSFTTLENQIEGGIYTCPAAGTGDSITAYLDMGANDVPCKAALYDGTDLIDNGACTETLQSLPDEEKTWPFGTSPTLANQAYIIVAWSESVSGTIKIGYDTGSSTRYREAETYNGFPDPIDGWDSTYGSIDVYIFCTYTAAAAEGCPTQSMYYHLRGMR